MPSATRTGISVVLVGSAPVDMVVSTAQRINRELSPQGLQELVVLVETGAGALVADALGQLPARIIESTSGSGAGAVDQRTLDLTSGQVVLIVHPGVEVTAQAVNEMRRVLDETREGPIGAVSCALVDEAGRLLPEHRRLPDLATALLVYSRPGAWFDRRCLGHRAWERATHADRPRVGAGVVGHASSSLLLLRRSTCDLLSGVLLDPTLSPSAAGLDLSWRLADAGLLRLVRWDVAVTCRGGGAAPFGRDALLGVLRRHRRRLLPIVWALPAAGEPGRNPVGEAPTGGFGPVPATVVIPAYNYGAYIAEAVESALAQTVPGVEILVVDDGSTDDTPQVLDRYADRIRVHRQANLGVSAARNVGASLARGRYVAFLDADNRLRPTFIERCEAALERNPAAGFAFTQLVHFGQVEFTTAVAPYRLEDLLDRNYIDMCTLVRRDLVTRHGFDERQPVGGMEDWDLWLNFAGHGWGGVLVDEPLVEYRHHERSATTTRTRRRARRSRLRIYWRHRRLVGWRRVANAAWRLLREPVDSRRAARSSTA